MCMTVCMNTLISDITTATQCPKALSISSCQRMAPRGALSWQPPASTTATKAKHTFYLTDLHLGSKLVNAIKGTVYESYNEEPGDDGRQTCAVDPLGAFRAQSHGLKGKELFPEWNNCRCSAGDSS